MGESGETGPRSRDEPPTARMIGDWSQAGGFFSSVLAGLLIGLAGDYFLDTDPWLVVTGVIAGFAVGFWRMFAYSDRILEQASNPRLQRLAELQRALDTEGDEDDA